MEDLSLLRKRHGTNYAATAKTKAKAPRTLAYSYSSIVLGQVALASMASAQSTTPNVQSTTSAVSVEEIVVTAQRRSESVQATPLAITALGGADLRNNRITELTALSNLTPNVKIANYGGQAHIAIRGIGINAVQVGAEPAIAVHVDGVYVSRPAATLDSFFDINRVEVVRGPQGTLYGRNATGGAVNIVTNDPSSDLRAFGEVTIGNYEAIATEGGIGGPIAPGVSARIAFQTQDRAGFGYQTLPVGLSTNPTGAPPNSNPPQGRGVTPGFREDLDDLKTRAVRAKLEIEPADDLTVLLAAEYFWENDHANFPTVIRRGPAGTPMVEELLGGVIAPNPTRNLYTHWPQRTHKEDWALTGTITWKRSPAFSLTSITGYRDTKFSKTQNHGGTHLQLAPYTDREKANQLSQELRADGVIGSLNYVVGGFLYRDEMHAEAIEPIHNIIFGFPAANSFKSVGYGTRVNLITKARALFTQVGYELSDQFGVDAGLRYSWERKAKPNELFGFSLFTPYESGVLPWQTGNPNDLNVTIGPRAATFESVTPKLTLRYKPTDSIHLYATYSRGFKSGGFNFGSGSDSAPYKPEKITDYEVGAKMEFFDRMLQVNLSGFYYDYSNLQVTRNADDGHSLVTESAGKARVYGGEASVIVVPTRGLRLNLDLGLLDGRYVNFTSVDSSLISCATSPVVCTVADPEKNQLAGVVQDLKGKRMVQAPTYTIHGGLQYTFESDWGALTLRGARHFHEQGIFRRVQP